MKLRHLTAQTMIAVTGGWLDPECERPILEAWPGTESLIPPLAEAHSGLANTQLTADHAAAARLKAVKRELGERAERHSCLVRANHLALTAFAEMAVDPKRKERLLALRDRIFQDGLKVINYSYLDAAGEVELVEERLDDEDRDLLASLPQPDGTLLETHAERVEAGRDLGKLAHERLDLKTGAKGKITRGDVLHARNQWIRMVRKLLGNLDLAPLAAKDRLRVLTPLEEAVAKAEDR